MNTHMCLRSKIILISVIPKSFISQLLFVKAISVYMVKGGGDRIHIFQKYLLMVKTFSVCCCNGWLSSLHNIH